MSKLRIGVLGGTRGIDFKNRVLNDHPYAEVTAVCEAHPGLKAKIESELTGSRAAVFSDYDEFLNSGLDAVIIANFANQHAPYAIRALGRGMHVLSENLPTQTMKEAVGLCEAVEKSGKLYAYGENYCFLPHVLEMRRMFESGSMGELMYAEGNFINDCSFKWHLLTRGDKNHWRNFVPSTFYCTHSIGPMLYVTGRRAETVVAMETQRMDYMAEVGARSGSAALEIMQLDNGAAAKSMNGNYRRDYTADYRFIASNGTIESDLRDFGSIRISMWDKEAVSYKVSAAAPPYEFDRFPVHKKPGETAQGFLLADIYLINNFIHSILGDSSARAHMIDVYRALDMSVPGLLAYRSILNQSNSVRIPDLRNKAERELWRNDNRSTDASLSSEKDLLPPCRSGFNETDDEVYQRVADRFNSLDLTSGSH